MNYLAHAYLSFGESDILLGNMIGDHVKGKAALDAFPSQIRKGIVLHRKIDEFVDTHPATLRAKIFFRADYGLYSGAIMDTLYDHFLANDPGIFPNEEALFEFSQQTYSALSMQSKWFPEKFAAYFPYMSEQNWLYNYRHVKGMERSLTGLNRRAKYMPVIDKAYATFIAEFYQLNQCYYEIITDLIKFSRSEISR